MSKRFSKAVTLLALSVLSTLALADAPARVGRIALAEGKVDISAQVGEETSAALVNWPVTTDNQIMTARGARTEIKVGSTAIRLEGDSALDVAELDDDTLRLHLHYGSVSIRVRNAEALAGFELTTPHGRVRLQEPGRVRVDAGRQQDTSTVSVFDGIALVDGGGSTLTIRANRRAELRGDDIITGAAQRDSFDDWALLRDRRDERAVSERYVGTEMTGYEDLDDHGTWRDDAEYGPLWTPRQVSSDWVPYRDGRWTYMPTWGWTWVDNAPWGYAPFHYGRWVVVNQRWRWSPGRHIGRPVWSPALVGWVGGAGWNVNFRSGGAYRHAPGQGWYPLSPRDTYVPHYHVKPDHLRYLNRHAQADRHDGNEGRSWRSGRQRDRHGLTVVPHDQFGNRSQVVVPTIARADVAPHLAQGAPAARPLEPARAHEQAKIRREMTMPYVERHDGVRVHPRYGSRDEARDRQRERGREQRQAAPQVTQTLPAQQQVIQTAPVQPQSGYSHEAQLDARRRDEARAQMRASRERDNAQSQQYQQQPQYQQPQRQPQHQQHQQQPQSATDAWAANARAAAMAAQREERERRFNHADHERRGAAVYAGQRQPAPMMAQPQPMQQAQPMPQPVQRAEPPPMAQPQPQSPPQSAPAARQREENQREQRPGRHQMMR